MAIWYPASGITYNQYLLANSFVRDVTGQVRTTGKAVLAKVSEQTKQLVASNQELARTFGNGFNSINSTLEWGFNRIEYALEDVRASVDSLHADFNYSMGLLLEEVHTHNKLLSSLLDKLDAIHKTLESPTLTQAREFYHIGCERLSKGLLDKALEALSQAEEKNDTDFFTQFRIGKLYLYGIDDDDNVLDLEKARQHLLLAARYAKAEIIVDPTFAELAAEALLHASVAIYAQLGEKHIVSDWAKTRALLEEARRLTAEATQLYPRLSEASYHSAKYSALLGDSQSSMLNLEAAILADRNYAVKVDIDYAFDPVRPNVLALLSRLKETKKIESQSNIAKAEVLFRETLLWHPEESGGLKFGFEECKADFASAQNHHKANTYFGFLDAITFAEAVMSSAPTLKAKRIDELKVQVSNSIGGAKRNLPAAGEYSEKVVLGIIQTNQLISRAESELSQLSYQSYKSALATAEAANLEAGAARKESREEDKARAKQNEKRREAELRRKRRNEASVKYSKCGAKIGAVVGFLGGMISCFAIVENSSFEGHFEPAANAFIGLAIGGIIGAVIGAIAGQMRRD